MSDRDFFGDNYRMSGAPQLNQDTNAFDQLMSNSQPTAPPPESQRPNWLDRQGSFGLRNGKTLGETGRDLLRIASTESATSIGSKHSVRAGVMRIPSDPPYGMPSGSPPPFSRMQSNNEMQLEDDDDDIGNLVAEFKRIPSNDFVMTSIPQFGRVSSNDVALRPSLSRPQSNLSDQPVIFRVASNDMRLGFNTPGRNMRQDFEDDYGDIAGPQEVESSDDEDVLDVESFEFTSTVQPTGPIVIGERPRQPQWPPSNAPETRQARTGSDSTSRSQQTHSIYSEYTESRSPQQQSSLLPPYPTYSVPPSHPYYTDPVSVSTSQPSVSRTGSHDGSVHSGVFQSYRARPELQRPSRKRVSVLSSNRSIKREATDRTRHQVASVASEEYASVQSGSVGSISSNPAVIGHLRCPGEGKDSPLPYSLPPDGVVTIRPQLSGFTSNFPVSAEVFFHYYDHDELKRDMHHMDVGEVQFLIRISKGRRLFASATRSKLDRVEVIYKDRSGAAVARLTLQQSHRDQTYKAFSLAYKSKDASIVVLRKFANSNGDKKNIKQRTIPISLEAPSGVSLRLVDVDTQKPVDLFQDPTEASIHDPLHVPA